MNVLADPVLPASRLVPSFHFSCTGLPEPRAWEMLRARFSTNFELHMPAGRPIDVAGGEHFAVLLGSLALARRRMSGLGISRSAALVRSSQMDHYMLMFSLVQQAPAQHFFDKGRVVEQRGNDLMVLDMARPMRVDLQAGNDVTLFIPRDALDKLLPRRVDLHGTAPKGITATLLANHLGNVLQRAEHVGQAEANFLAHSTLHMVAACLAPQADSMALARPELDGLLRRRVGSYVEEHIANPDLSAEHLCAAFHMSRSCIYRLLEPAGGPAAFIRERRLNKVHQLLAASQRRVLFKQVADDFGFRSASQLSQSFKEHFGYNPKELRERPKTCAARSMRTSCAVQPPSSAGVRGFDQWLQGLGH